MHIPVRPVTKISLPHIVSDNTLLRAKMPTKHVASPWSMVSNKPATLPSWSFISGKLVPAHLLVAPPTGAILQSVTHLPYPVRPSSRRCHLRREACARILGALHKPPYPPWSLPGYAATFLMHSHSMTPFSARLPATDHLLYCLSFYSIEHLASFIGILLHCTITIPQALIR